MKQASDVQDCSSVGRREWLDFFMPLGWRAELDDCLMGGWQVKLGDCSPMLASDCFGDFSSRMNQPRRGRRDPP